MGLEQGYSLELSSERGSLLLEDVDTLRDGLALVGLWHRCDWGMVWNELDRGVAWSQLDWGVGSN